MDYSGKVSCWLTTRECAIDFQALDKLCRAFISIDNIYIPTKKGVLKKCQNKNQIRSHWIIYFTGVYFGTVCNIDCYLVECAWTENKPPLTSHSGDVSLMQSKFKAMILQCIKKSCLDFNTTEKTFIGNTGCEKCSIGVSKPVKTGVSVVYPDINGCGCIWKVLSPDEGVIFITKNKSLIWFNRSHLYCSKYQDITFYNITVQFNFHAEPLWVPQDEGQYSWYQAVCMWDTGSKKPSSFKGQSIEAWLPQSVVTKCLKDYALLAKVALKNKKNILDNSFKDLVKTIEEGAIVQLNTVSGSGSNVTSTANSKVNNVELIGTVANGGQSSSSKVKPIGTVANIVKPKETLNPLNSKIMYDSQLLSNNKVNVYSYVQAVGVRQDGWCSETDHLLGLTRYKSKEDLFMNLLLHDNPCSYALYQLQQLFKDTLQHKLAARQKAKLELNYYLEQYDLGPDYLYDENGCILMRPIGGLWIVGSYFGIVVCPTDDWFSTNTELGATVMFDAYHDTVLNMYIATCVWEEKKPSVTDLCKNLGCFAWESLLDTSQVYLGSVVRVDLPSTAFVSLENYMLTVIVASSVFGSGSHVILEHVEVGQAVAVSVRDTLSHPYYYATSCYDVSKTLKGKTMGMFLDLQKKASYYLTPYSKEVPRSKDRLVSLVNSVSDIIEEKLVDSVLGCKIIQGRGIVTKQNNKVGVIRIINGGGVLAIFYIGPATDFLLPGMVVEFSAALILGKTVLLAYNIKKVKHTPARKPRLSSTCSHGQLTLGGTYSGVVVKLLPPYAAVVRHTSATGPATDVFLFCLSFEPVQGRGCLTYLDQITSYLDLGDQVLFTPERANSFGGLHAYEWRAAAATTLAKAKGTKGQQDRGVSEPVHFDLAAAVERTLRSQPPAQDVALALDSHIVNNYDLEDVVGYFYRLYNVAPPAAVSRKKEMVNTQTQTLSTGNVVYGRIFNLPTDKVVQCETACRSEQDEGGGGHSDTHTHTHTHPVH